MLIKSVQLVKDYLKTKQQFKYARETSDQSHLESIRNTLKLGKKLQTNEMDYLQRHDPNLYDQAMNLSIERQAYEYALQHSHSKAEANEFQKFRLLQIAGELRRGGSEEQLMRMNAIQEAHREFVRSSKYASLRSDRYALRK